MKTLKKVIVSDILIALVYILIINGCSHQPVSEPETRKEMLHELQDYLIQIPEPDRRERVMDLLDKLAEGLAELNRTVTQFGMETKQLNADYDATRADFQKLLAKFNTSRQVVQQKLLTTHYEIKELTTEKEWAGIAKMEKQAVEKILRQNLLDAYPKTGS